MAYNRSRPIPGTTGRRVPGTARLPKARRLGGHRTRVPYQEGGSDIFREYHRQQVRDSRGHFAGGWGFAWQGLEEVADNMENYGLRFSASGSLKDAVERLKDDMVSYAQANAPWTDRTGNARKELQGVVVWNDNTHFTIFLGHGKEIYYGIWLEVRWGGRYAIILPTIHAFAPQIGDRIRTMT